MRSAVLDRVIALSPCVRVALPTSPRKSLAVPSAADVAALAAAMPSHLAVVPYLAAGLGLRPGEVFGLEVSDIDFLRRSVQIERQLDERGERVPLKTASSQRTVPLPSVVAERLSANWAGTVALSHPDAARQEDFLCRAKLVTLLSLVQAASGRTRAAWGEARAPGIEYFAATPGGDRLMQQCRCRSFDVDS